VRWRNKHREQSQHNMLLQLMPASECAITHVITAARQTTGAAPGQLPLTMSSCCTWLIPQLYLGNHEQSLIFCILYCKCT